MSLPIISADQRLADLLARIRTIERAIAGTTQPVPIAGLAGFSRGDR
ncbi:hypothetical protein [Actibacterium sp. D379-3]